MAARCNWSQPIYFARLHKFFRHFWQNLSKGSFGQLTTFPEDLFPPVWKALILRHRDKETNTVVPGTLTSPVIGHVTAGLLSVTASTFRRVLQGGGGTWGSSKTGKVFFFNAKRNRVPRPSFFFLFFFLSPSCAASSVEKSFYCHGRWHFSKAVIAQSPAFILPGGSRALPLVFKRKSLQH